MRPQLFIYRNRKKNTYSKIFLTKWKTSTFAKICPGQARLPTLKGITFSCLRNSPSTIYRSGENLYASGKYFSDIWMPIKLSMGSKIVIYGWKYLKFGYRADLLPFFNDQNVFETFPCRHEIIFFKCHSINFCILGHRMNKRPVNTGRISVRLPDRW